MGDAGSRFKRSLSAAVFVSIFAPALAFCQERPALSGPAAASNPSQTEEQTIIAVSPDRRGTINVQIDDPSIYARTELITLKNLVASEIEPFVKSRLSKFGAVQTNDESNVLIITERDPKLKDLVGLVGKLDAFGSKDFLRLETELLKLRYVKPSGLLGFAKQRLSDDGTVQADDSLNILVITDVRSRIDRFKKIVEGLDVPAPQIVFEVHLVEAEKSKDRRVGIDWSNLVNLGVSGGLSWYDYGSGLKSRTASLSLISSTNLGDILGLLDEKGTLKLLSSARLATVNNASASMTLSPSGPFESRTGVQISILPTIGRGDLVTVRVDAGLLRPQPETDAPSSSKRIVVRGQDQTQQRIQTTIQAERGKPFVIGGLTRTNLIERKRRFPLLGYVLAFLFSRTIVSEQENEMAIFLTPRVLPRPESVQKELDETLEKGK